MSDISEKIEEGKFLTIPEIIANYQEYKLAQDVRRNGYPNEYGAVEEFRRIVSKKFEIFSEEDIKELMVYPHGYEAAIEASEKISKIPEEIMNMEITCKAY